ncbi:hypothetical protein TIFTF001_046427, partial [Ficus carica]
MMMIRKFSHVVLTCTRMGLVHGLSWIGLAVPTTPCLHATMRTLMLSKLPTLLKIVDYTTVIYRRVKFTRRLDNRRVIQRRGRYHDGSKTVV